MTMPELQPIGRIGIPVVLVLALLVGVAGGGAAWGVLSEQVSNLQDDLDTFDRRLGRTERRLDRVLGASEPWRSEPPG